MARIDPPRRPYYAPTDRLAILQLRAARGWSLEQTAKAFLVTAATIATWVQRVDEAGPAALLQLPKPRRFSVLLFDSIVTDQPRPPVVATAEPPNPPGFPWKPCSHVFTPISLDQHSGERNLRRARWKYADKPRHYHDEFRFRGLDRDHPVAIDGLSGTLRRPAIGATAEQGNWLLLRTLACAGSPRDHTRELRDPG